MQASPMIQFTEWQAEGNGVRRFYRVTKKGATEPSLFEIHCDLSKGFTGIIDTFVNFLVFPGLGSELINFSALTIRS
jgi:hypothetical protein